MREAAVIAGEEEGVGVAATAKWAMSARNEEEIIEQTRYLDSISWDSTGLLGQRAGLTHHGLQNNSGLDCIA